MKVILIIQSEIGAIDSYKKADLASKVKLLINMISVCTK
jgi:hypothetical protein